MRKSFLEMIGENLSGNIYGIDIYNTLQRQEASQDMEAAEELDAPATKMKAVKEKNKRR